MSESELKYGAVLFIKGKRKGQIGYYDNDEFDERTNKEKAVVYLGKAFLSNYILINHDKLKNITSLEHERFKKENADLAKYLGIN